MLGWASSGLIVILGCVAHYTQEQINHLGQNYLLLCDHFSFQETTQQRQNLKAEKIPQECLFTNFPSKVISSCVSSLFEFRWQISSPKCSFCSLYQIFQLLNFAVMIKYIFNRLDCIVLCYKSDVEHQDIMAASS